MQNPKQTYRAAIADCLLDIERITQLLDSTADAIHNGAQETRRAEVESDLKRREIKMFVCEIAGTVQAYIAWLWAHEHWTIYKIVVDDTHRREGVGRCLYDFSLLQCLKIKHSPFVSVVSDLIAIGFYSRLGFLKAQLKSTPEPDLSVQLMLLNFTPDSYTLPYSLSET